MSIRWHPPPSHFYELNFDVTVELEFSHLYQILMNMMICAFRFHAPIHKSVNEYESPDLEL